jgi:chemotaxis protein MotB
MKAVRPLAALLACSALVCSSGCLVPRAQLTDCEARNRALAEQHRAQLAEIDNLKIHNRNTEDRLMRTEEDLAVLEERLGASKNQLVNYEREHSALQEQLQGLAAGGHTARIPLDIAKRLEALSRRFPSLQFDPNTGISKLDSDVLFDSGNAELKPGAQELVAELVRVLQSPEAGELRVMVVGHTDDRQMAKRPARDVFPNNFHLSTTRALAVADAMRQAGLPDKRLGVAGMGGHEPVAPNTAAQDRQKNRRVEIFVLPPDVPIVGWTDSMPSVY